MVDPEWVAQEMGAHIARLSIADAPEPGTPPWDDAVKAWCYAFRRMEPPPDRETVAWAGRACLENPVRFWAEQLKTIIGNIQSFRAANIARGETIRLNEHGEPTPGDAPQYDRAGAERASTACELCEGAGMVLVFHRLYDGRPFVEVGPSRLPGQVRVACSCPLGRWIAAARLESAGRLKTKDQQDRARADAEAFDGLRRVLSGEVPYQLDDPTEPPPTPPGSGPVDWSKWREHFKRWAREA